MEFQGAKNSVSSDVETTDKTREQLWTMDLEIEKMCCCLWKIQSNHMEKLRKMLENLER